MEIRSVVSVIARIQLWTDGEREGGDFLSMDVLKIAEQFEEDKFIRDLKGSLSSHQEKRTKCGEI